MSAYGHMTSKECYGRALQLIQALDAAIHYATGYYYEPLRKYVRCERDPLTSTVLEACRAHNMQLIACRNTNGIYHGRIPMAFDADIRKYCMKLRARLLEDHPQDHAQVLYDLDLSETKLDQWTREDCSSPRWSELVRLARRLHYRVWFYDPHTDYRIH